MHPPEPVKPQQGTTWNWSFLEDVCLCSRIIESGNETREPYLGWIRESFNPIPAELSDRTHASILLRFKYLRPALLLELQQHGYSRDALCKWLSERHAKSAQHSESSFTLEQDLALCVEVLHSWRARGPNTPGQKWFQDHVVGKIAVLAGRTNHSLYGRFSKRLARKLQQAVLDHNDQWTRVVVDFDWLKQMHGVHGPASVEADHEGDKLEHLANALETHSNHHEGTNCNNTNHSSNGGVVAPSPMLFGAKQRLGIQPLDASLPEPLARAISSERHVCCVDDGRVEWCHRDDLPADVRARGAMVLEPPVKKQRRRVVKTQSSFTYEEDETICTTVLRSANQDDVDLSVAPSLGQRWFEVNLVQPGLIAQRSCQSLYCRYRKYLQPGMSEQLSDVAHQAQLAGKASTPQEREMRVLDWLRKQHDILWEVENVDVMIDRSEMEKSE